MEKKCLLMELNYIMLMYGTQLHNMDNMIPDHGQRIQCLLQRLSPASSATHQQPSNETRTQVQDVDRPRVDEEKGDEALEIAIGFI